MALLTLHLELNLLLLDFTVGIELMTNSIEAESEAARVTNANRVRSVPEQIATILRKKYQLCEAPIYEVKEGHTLVLCVLGLKLSSGGREWDVCA